MSLDIIAHTPDPPWTSGIIRMPCAPGVGEAQTAQTANCVNALGPELHTAISPSFYWLSKSHDQAQSKGM